MLKYLHVPKTWGGVPVFQILLSVGGGGGGPGWVSGRGGLWGSEVLDFVYK